MPAKCLVAFPIKTQHVWMKTGYIYFSTLPCFWNQLVTLLNRARNIFLTSLNTVTLDIALFILLVSPEDDDVVSADEDTVAMDVKDSEDGKDALSE